MKHKRLKETLLDKSKFAVVAELISGPNFSFFPMENFLKDYKNSEDASIPEGFDFVAIASPHNAGGTPGIGMANVLSHMQAQKLLDQLDFVAHLSGKDQNADALVSSLAGFRAMDIETVLAMTGDKPVKGKGVFELESIGILQMIKQMNSEGYLKARPDELDNVRQFFPGAVVSPFKYTEASQMQQYYKMEKKIACGAEFIVTQVGWDWKKSMELFRYLEENNLDVPILGNAFLLSKMTSAPKLMHDVKVPGCFISDQLLAKVYSETISEQLERAAQQVAMYKSIGAAGVDVGSIHVFRMLVHILQRASEIGESWVEYKDNLYWPQEGGFYLYDDKGHRTALSRPKKKFGHKCFDFMHRNVLTEDTRPFKTMKKVMSFVGARKNRGLAYELFTTFEYAVKRALFDCEMCGDCYLAENFGLCTVGGCEKGLANAPCGDATVDGYCGNNLDLLCIGEHIYNAAASQADGIEQWRAIINRPRIHSLEQTASILNHLFGRDHYAKVPFVCISQLINASIPKTGRILQQLHDLGADAYSKPGGPLNYVKAMIESQVAKDPDYIAVNLDAVGRKDPQRAVDMMIEYVKMIHKWGKTIPVCIDSSDTAVLTAGLKEWHNTNQQVEPSLLGSVQPEDLDGILPLKKHYDFKLITIIAGKNEKNTVDNLYSLAKQVFEKAAAGYGFKTDDLFLEFEVCPLAMDSPEETAVPGRTYVAFETMKKIRADRRMKGVHCLMRPAAVGRKLPRTIGVCRAYIARAVKYGLDAAFVNVAHRYGLVEPDPELLKLIDACANRDGSVQRNKQAAMVIDRYKG
ncbi:MAG: methylenetetrahydrofolate reductase C-terminal domain-containing protein [Planctomycetota bacterium]|jgi:methylenetetrahydrofolate reductase (NADPH)